MFIRHSELEQEAISTIFWKEDCSISSVKECCQIQSRQTLQAKYKVQSKKIRQLRSSCRRYQTCLDAYTCKRLERKKKGEQGLWRANIFHNPYHRQFTPKSSTGSIIQTYTVTHKIPQIIFTDK